MTTITMASHIVAPVYRCVYRVIPGTQPFVDRDVLVGEARHRELVGAIAALGDQRRRQCRLAQHPLERRRQRRRVAGLDEQRVDTVGGDVAVAVERAGDHRACRPPSPRSGRRRTTRRAATARRRPTPPAGGPTSRPRRCGPATRSARRRRARSAAGRCRARRRRPSTTRRGRAAASPGAAPPAPCAPRGGRGRRSPGARRGSGAGGPDRSRLDAVEQHGELVVLAAEVALHERERVLRHDDPLVEPVEQPSQHRRQQAIAGRAPGGVERADRRGDVERDGRHRRARAPAARGRGSRRTPRRAAHAGCAGRPPGSGASGAIDPLAAVGRLSPSGVTNGSGGGPSHGREHAHLVPAPPKVAGQPEHLGLHTAGDRQAVRAHHPDPQAHAHRTYGVWACRLLRAGDGAGVAEAAGEILRLERARQQVALTEVAPEAPQLAQLAGGLDPLRHRQQVERVGHLQDRARQRVAARVAPELLDRGAVDLEQVDRVALEVAQRAVPGAEVVDRESEALLAEAGDGLGGAVALVDEHGLGQLEHHRLRIDVVLVDERDDALDEVGLADLHGRDVEAAEQLRPPHRDLRQPLLDHPVPHRHDQAGPLGDRHELAGRDVAVLRVVPAHERLGAHHLARAEVDERHVDEPHLAALERLAEVAAVLEVLGGDQPHRRVEDPDLALAGALRLVHRDVGIAQQAGRAHAGRRHGDADAGEHGDVVAGDRHRVAQAVEQSLGDVDRAVDAAAVLEQDRELVAAEAGGGVAGAGGAADAIGDGLQQLVADGVAERVVDRLEVVEVDEQHDDRVGLGTGDAQGVVHAVEEQRPVGEPGQLVVEGAVAELALEVALLGDVAERGDDAVDGGAADEVGDDDGRLAELAVGVDQRRLELDRAAVAELDESFELTDRAARARPRRRRRAGGARPSSRGCSRASPAGRGWRS